MLKEELKARRPPNFYDNTFLKAVLKPNLRQSTKEITKRHNHYLLSFGGTIFVNRVKKIAYELQKVCSKNQKNVILKRRWLDKQHPHFKSNHPWKEDFIDWDYRGRVYHKLLKIYLTIILKIRAADEKSSR